jgi:hypothetical protein
LESKCPSESAWAQAMAGTSDKSFVSRFPQLGRDDSRSLASVIQLRGAN